LKKPDLVSKIVDLQSKKDSSYNTATEALRLAKLSKPALQTLLSELENGSGNDSTSQRMKWDSFMVEVLLRTRIDSFGRAYAGSKSNSQLKLLWEKIAMQFNREILLKGYTAKQTSKQLRDKYAAVKVKTLLL